MDKYREALVQLEHADNRIARLTTRCERLYERITELKIACNAALNWHGLDGDGISQPVLDHLRKALGLPALEEAHDE